MLYCILRLACLLMICYNDLLEYKSSGVLDPGIISDDPYSVLLS